jgi:hypothetical protein
MSYVSSGIAIAGAVYQGYQAVKQSNDAANLKKSNFRPQGLDENKDLAKNDVLSGRFPGQGLAEENVRRNFANQIAAAQRMFGGDANKIGAVSGGIGANANDALARIASMGSQFSQNAKQRLANATSAVAQQDQNNYMQYIQAKNALKQSSKQNAFNAVQNGAAAALMARNGSQSATSIDPSTKAMSITKSLPQITDMVQSNPLDQLSGDINTEIYTPFQQMSASRLRQPKMMLSGKYNKKIS